MSEHSPNLSKSIIFAIYVTAGIVILYYIYIYIQIDSYRYLDTVHIICLIFFLRCLESTKSCSPVGSLQATCDFLADATASDALRTEPSNERSQPY